MIYLLLRNLIRLALRGYFRKVHVLNEIVTAVNKPVILAANHPNGVMDILVLIALLSKNTYYFLVPADMMIVSWKARLLKWLNCIPVERGEEKLSMQTLGKCSDILKNKGKLIVFAEDKSHQAKRLTQISNDAGSIALDVEESYGFNLDIMLIPVALNYTYFNLFRSELMISLALPIPMIDFKNAFQEHKEQAFSSLNENISKGLTAEMVIIEQEEHEIVTERLLTINRNDCDIPSIPWKSKQQDKLRFDQIIVGYINKLATQDAPTLMGLTQKTSDYFGQLASFGLNDQNLSATARKGLVKYLLLVLTLPLFCIGYVCNIVPIWLTGVSSPSNVENPVWHEANRFLKGIGYWTIYYLIITTVTYRLGGLYAGLSVGLLIPVSGYFALYYREWGKSLLDTVRFWMANSSKAELIDSLRLQREEIIQLMIKKPVRKPVAGINLTQGFRSN